MKRILNLALMALLVAAVAPKPASALGEVMQGIVLEDSQTNPFGCRISLKKPAGAPAECNIHQRYYGDLDPTIINGPAAPVDGFPFFKKAGQRYLGDQQSTANFPGINADSDRCEAWYSVWDAVTGPNTGTFISYYAAQSNITNIGETGDAKFADCVNPAGNAGQSCFGLVDAASATGTSPSTPVGNLSRAGGMEPVPVPRVSMDAANPQGQPAGQVLVAWSGAGNVNTVNRPGSTACSPGSSFNDQTDANGPNPVFGVRLYVHAISPLVTSSDPTKPINQAAFRSLASLEGAALDSNGFLNILPNSQNSRMACSGTGSDPNCPGVHLVPCGAAGVTGGVCVGNAGTFAPGSQSIQIARTDLDGILGTDGPVSGNNNAVLNTKVVYRGAESGSHGGARGLSNNVVNPALVSLFSANSTRISFDSLVSRISFARHPQVTGN
ncbi:MAG: hypothetical protein ACE5ID_08325, partial [Acidobacteriota bacterium]